MFVLLDVTNIVIFPIQCTFLQAFSRFFNKNVAFSDNHRMRLVCFCNVCDAILLSTDIIEPAFS